MKENLHLLQPFTERLGFILRRGKKTYIGQGTMLVCDPVELSFRCCWWRAVNLTPTGPTPIEGKGIRQKSFTLRLQEWAIVTTSERCVDIVDKSNRNLITLTPHDLTT